MTTEPTRAIKIFFSYARKDKTLLEELEKHLEVLRRSGQVMLWLDREIQPGAEWKREIDVHLDTSRIILLLVSPNFIHSNYCYGIEMPRALERHKTGDAHVIPIILRPVAWKETPIGELQVLPVGGKPITTWRNRDEAFQDVVRGIGEVVRILRAQKTKEQWIVEGDGHYRAGHYNEALGAFNQALRLDPSDIMLPYLKEQVLHNGFRCNEEQYLAYVQELADIDKCILIDPLDAHFYYQKSQILTHLQRDKEALDAIEQAIHLNPNEGTFYHFKGHLLWSVGESWEDSLVVYDQLIRLHATDATAYHQKALVLHFLYRSDEALTAIDQAIRLDPDEPNSYILRDIILGISDSKEPDWG